MHYKRKKPRHEPARDHRGEYDKAGRAYANDWRREPPMPCLLHQECELANCIYRQLKV